MRYFIKILLLFLVVNANAQLTTMNSYLIPQLTGIYSINGFTSGAVNIVRGTSGSDYNIVSAANTITINIPYAATGVAGLINVGAQNIPGNKTIISHIGPFSTALSLFQSVVGVGAGSGFRIYNGTGDLFNIEAYEAASGSEVFFKALDGSAVSQNRLVLLGASGNFGVGDMSPASLFTVGSGDLFQVNSSGDVVKLKNVTYSWPAANAVGNLRNNGSGTLSWLTPAVSDSAWSKIGNAGTVAGTNFLGTIDSVDMVIKAYSNDAIRILARNRFVGIGTSTPITRLEVTTNGIGPTPLDTPNPDTTGFLVSNHTAAILGTQQVSPSVRWQAQGFATTPAASRAVEFRAYVLPSQGGSNPSGIMVFQSSINGGAWNNGLQILSGANPVVQVAHLSLNTTGNLQWASSSLITAPSNGVIKLSDNVSADFNRLQLGGTTSSFPSLQRSGAGLISRLADNSGDATFRAFLRGSAGSATAGTAPLKLASGTLNTTAEDGAIEYDGTEFYATNSTPARAMLSRVLKGSGTLDFPSTGAQTSADLTITVTGAADGDAVYVGAQNASTNANTSFTAWVSATNTVTVRFNNYSSGSVDPASGTFKVTVNK